MKRNLRDSYKYYKENTSNPIGIRDYLLIVGDYNKFLIGKVLEGEEVTLPARMGTLEIVGRKQNLRIGEDGKVRGLAPDYVKTKELWDNNPEAKAQKKYVYHTNPHTDNRRYKYLWSKSRVLVTNKTLYALRITRGNKRLASDSIKKGVEYKTVN